MEYAIHVEHVSKHYKLYKNPQDRLKEAFSFAHKKYHEDFCALDDISFDVKSGETLGIIGKNGAGKSTLLKLITGVATPTSGLIEVNGQISALLELGTGFNPEFNGYQNIYLNGTMRGFSMEEMDAKLQEIISFADIGEYISQAVKTYSSGMFARLAFAVMISFKPEILIVDEALSVGDIFFQQKCNTYMKEEMKGVTKLLVTHDMNSISNMADRVILLEQGRILQEGKPLEVIETYLKMMHSSVFHREEPDAPPKDMELNLQKNNLDYNEVCVPVSVDKMGGANEIRILSCGLYINGVVTDLVKPGDHLEICGELETDKTTEGLIVGYIFKDKYGNSILGENTLGSELTVQRIEQGERYFFELAVDWPEVMEGDYFLTVGLGEGTDQMLHVIQCWAHNILHVKAIAARPMHGIVNNVIQKIHLRNSSPSYNRKG